MRNTKALLVFLLIQGCTHLDEVEKVLESRESPSFIFLSEDPRLRPGTTTLLPMRMQAPTSPVNDLEQCGMQAIVEANGGYRENILYGNWFSDRIWIRFSSSDVDGFRQFESINKWDRLSYSYLAIKFDDLSLQVLDPDATTYNFMMAHPAWGTADYMNHFDLCLPPSEPDRYLLHQVLLARLVLRFHNLIGLPVRRNEKLSEQLKLMGFLPGNGDYEYVSMNYWAVARSSRLRLSNLGFFRQPKFTQASTVKIK